MFSEGYFRKGMQKIFRSKRENFIESRGSGAREIFKNFLNQARKILKSSRKILARD